MYLTSSRHLFLTLCFLTLTCISQRSHAFEDVDKIEDDHTLKTPPNHDHHEQPTGPLPKDKILLDGVKKMVFLRNKRTTSRRTHSIPQLSCVGGTAGCKLFTPDVVECEKVIYSGIRIKHDWRCHAELSDRVIFNHVEVICEGYDYPEDDYILLGSCGLEFTLDYANPHDYHDNSYFKHMDEHEKEMHHERVRSKENPTVDSSFGIWALIKGITNYMSLIGGFLFFALCSIVIIVKTLKTNGNNKIVGGATGRQASRVSSYGPLTSAVLTTKKAC